MSMSTKGQKPKIMNLSAVNTAITVHVNSSVSLQSEQVERFLTSFLEHNEQRVGEKQAVSTSIAQLKRVQRDLRGLPSEGFPTPVTGSTPAAIAAPVNGKKHKRFDDDDVKDEVNVDEMKVDDEDAMDVDEPEVPDDEPVLPAEKEKKGKKEKKDKKEKKEKKEKKHKKTKTDTK